MRRILHTHVMNLLKATIELARNTREPVSHVCKEVGVTPRWLQMLLAGQIKDPSVRRIQKLHDYLEAPKDLVVNSPLD